MALPFMPFYWGDYWRDTAHLSDAEHVSYLRLISHYWQHGSLPVDASRLARIAGRSASEWAEMAETLKEFFSDGWHHARIERDLMRQKELSDANSERAKKAANARWNAPSITQAYVEQSLTNANQNQNQNHIQNKIIDNRSVKSSRGTRLPQDWKPKEEDGFDEVELAKFRDYWIAVSGQKGVKRDWDATWRNWLRNAKQWDKGSPRNAFGKNGEKTNLDTFRIGHPKGVIKFEPEKPKLTEAELAERAKFVEQTLKGLVRAK